MFSRRVWYVACAAATVLAVGGIGAAFALKQPPGRASAGRAAVAYCGLVACSVLPSHTTSTATADATAPDGVPAGSRARGRTATPRTLPAESPSAPATAPPATPTPEPTATAGPSPVAAGATVTVAYSVPQHWDGGFQGEVTIVNHGDSAVNGWQIVITLPGDQVDTVWNAQWQQGGATLTMTPASYNQVLDPGASQSVNFVAKGNTTNPANCTFNGSACR
jgi:hypothetical protein